MQIGIGRLDTLQSLQTKMRIVPVKAEASSFIWTHMTENGYSNSRYHVLKLVAPESDGVSAHTMQVLSLCVPH